MDSPSLRLPAGMRDYAPRAAAARRRIAETLLGVFERWGFARVITPAFEYEDVLALGLGPKGRAAAIRFVEPSSGRVVALRPDITPQIARLCATRYRDEVGPLRLCYEGTVVRLEPGARAQREIIQAGVELAGVDGPRGDAEVVALAVTALEATGLPQPTIDLGHLGLAREILRALELPPGLESSARRLIGKRDRAGIDEVLQSARASRAIQGFVRLLPDWAGPPSILAKAAKRAPTPGIRRALTDLAATVREIEAQEMGVPLRVDLAEMRGFDYYTGVRFQAYVEGASNAVLGGGRYDDLLGRYGRPSPAVGFAVDVEEAAGVMETQLAQSREADGDGAGGANRAANGSTVLVTGNAREAMRAAQTLRLSGRSAAVELNDLKGSDLTAYAERWGFSEVIVAGGKGRRSAGKSSARYSTAGGR